MQQQYLRKWIGNNLNNSFRFMSYNILADSLIDYSKRNDNYFLWKVRWPRLFAQIQLYNPQILCIQEMDQTEKELSLRLENQQYTKLYLKRDTNQNQDGCAIFFLNSSFYLINKYEIHLMQEHLKVGESSNLDKPNICLIAVIQNKQKNKPPIIIANTHLLFNKNRGDIKLAQIQMVMLAVQQLQLKYNGSVIFCGDFNLIPHSALYQYLSIGQFQFNNQNCKRISGQYQINYHPQDYISDRVAIQKKVGKYDQNYELLQNQDQEYDLYAQALKCELNDNIIEFKQGNLVYNEITDAPIKLKSVYSEIQSSCLNQLNDFYAKWSTYEPLITTMSESQVGCVDYIWINSLQIAQVLSIPHIKTLIENPIPNEYEGSDHLPLVCDLYQQ